MLALIQRVRRASVTIDGAVVGAIGPGLLVLVCAEQGDTPAQADKLLSKILKLRIFSDTQGKMNRCVQDLDGAGQHGGLLVVQQARGAHSEVATGVFAADMQVELVNDGPVTIPMRVAPAGQAA